MRNFLLLLFITISYFSFSQDQALIDSLTKQIELAESDTLKVDLWNQISAHYIYTSTAKGLEPALKAESISNEINYETGKINALIRLGVCYFRLSKYDSSTIYYQKGLKIAEQENDSVYILKYKRNIALNQSRKGNYDEALNCFLDILKINEVRNENANASVLLEIATIYYHLKDFESAYIRAKEAFDLASVYNLLRIKANALNSMGVFLNELDRLKESEECYVESYKLKKQLDDKVGQANTLINIASMHTRRNDYKKANVFLDTVLLLAKATGSQQVLASALTNQGSNFHHLKQYEKAIETTIAALDIFIELGSLKQELSTIGNIANTYYLLNDYKNAVKYYRKARILNDSVFNLNMLEKVAEMRTQFDTEKKEEENLRLLKENELQALKIQVKAKEKKNSIIVISSISASLILLILMLFFRFRNQKKHELTQKIAEQKELNLIEVIEAEEKERIRFARDLHDGLGQLLSTARINIAALEENIDTEDKSLLDNSMSLIDQSVNEVRNISHNIMPVSLMRYGLKSALEDMFKRINDTGEIKINSKINGLDDRFSEINEINIYRLVQEIINNILKHANATFINISIEKVKKSLNLFIINDGKQLDISMINKGKGIGWNNIYARVNIMNGIILIEPNIESGTELNIQLSI
jgi:two-component system, NarL family, sensor kinase